MSALNKDKFLNSEELQHLEDLLKRHESRDALLVGLTLRTGARASEALNVTKADLNASDKSVMIRGLKGSNDREIPLAPMFFNKLQEHAKDLNPEDRLFPISYERFVQIWNNYRPSKKGIHSLRHSFALNLYRRCKDIRLVQTAMGHRSLNSTLVYSTYVHTVSELRRAIL